jgi:hypothetical protein
VITEYAVSRYRLRRGYTNNTMEDLLQYSSTEDPVSSYVHHQLLTGDSGAFAPEVQASAGYLGTESIAES